MKTIVRLTESDLHRLIKESVKSILREGNFRSGYVGHDGNHMVGGSWWADETTKTVTLDADDLFETISEALNLDEDADEELWNALVDKEFHISATFEEGEDESVGMSQYAELSNVDDYDGLDELLYSLYGQEQGEIALDAIFNDDIVERYNWESFDYSEE